MTLHPLIIGVLHSPACMQMLSQKALQEALEHIDFLEVRLDTLLDLQLPPSWPRPMIATARHPREGGTGNLSLHTRCKLLENSISWASAIDMELRSFKELTETRIHAREKGCMIIASFHDFETVPPTSYLEELALQAAAEGADFLKIAVTPHSHKELERLIAFQKHASLVLSTACMGMGPLGQQSRLLLVEAGAALAYGWLYHPQVVGQWSVEELISKFSYKS